MTASLAWFDTDKCFIDGRWAPAQSNEFLPLEDPSRGAEIGAIARGRSGDVNAAVDAAERALKGDWGRLAAAERGRLLMRLGELVKTRVDETRGWKPSTSASRPGWGAPTRWRWRATWSSTAAQPTR
jgi:aldehyde dehydrogenase (NAD+)